MLVCRHTSFAAVAAPITACVVHGLKSVQHTFTFTCVSIHAVSKGVHVCLLQCDRLSLQAVRRALMCMPLYVYVPSLDVIACMQRCHVHGCWIGMPLEA